ncbi:MAG: hypothetical protein ABII22_02880 [Candidatus Micrarchaeota archaeon]
MTEKMITQEKKEEKLEQKKKRVLQLWDEDQIEVKRLDLEDVEDTVVLLKKCTFEVTEKEVAGIISFNVSFGSYVNRMLIGIGLAWPTHLDIDSKTMTSGDPNALYFEDPAVILAYEGRGVRRILLKAREEEAKQRSFKYAISYVSEDIPKGSIGSYIKEGGSQLEKLYMSEGYNFVKTDNGLLALKSL